LWLKSEQKEKSLNFLTMSAQWYYVDGSGTVGPVSQEVLSSTYKDGKLNDDSYVWNGTTVKEWKAIRDVAGLSVKLKPKPKPKPKPVAAKPKPAAARPKPAAGGGGANAERNNLLAAIRAGKKLKKKPKTEEKTQKPVAQLSLAEQMKLKLQQRGQGQPGRKPKKVKSVGKKSQSNAVRKTQPKSGGKKYGTGGGGGGTVLPYKLKNKIGNIKNDLGKLTASDEWKILAIEKILS